MVRCRPVHQTQTVTPPAFGGVKRGVTQFDQLAEAGRWAIEEFGADTQGDRLWGGEGLLSGEVKRLAQGAGQRFNALA